ncbi:MAG: DUF3784 domain-containing protein [Eubacteriales bacterium]|nr:DUF3784 domain-containing protein [Eubacteriales bacterium]
MDRSLDFILAVGALIVGIMLVAGHGSVFMKGGNTQQRKAVYDEKKMEKASGVALILIGIATGIDSYTQGLPAKLAYIAVLVIIMVVLVYYLRTKCKK